MQASTYRTIANEVQSIILAESGNYFTQAEFATTFLNRDKAFLSRGRKLHQDGVDNLITKLETFWDLVDDQYKPNVDQLIALCPNSKCGKDCSNCSCQEQQYYNDHDKTVISTILNLTEHRSYYNVAKQLEALNVPTVAGGKWSGKTVKAILTRNNLKIVS